MDEAEEDQLPGIVGQVKWISSCQINKMPKSWFCLLPCFQRLRHKLEEAVSLSFFILEFIMLACLEAVDSINSLHSLFPSPWAEIGCLCAHSKRFSYYGHI